MCDHVCLLEKESFSTTWVHVTTRVRVKPAQYLIFYLQKHLFGFGSFHLHMSMFFYYWHSMMII